MHWRHLCNAAEEPAARLARCGTPDPPRLLRLEPDLKRNCRLRLDTSIVSMSITSMLPKPVRARSLRSSHPRPPAPTTSTLQAWRHCHRHACRRAGPFTALQAPVRDQSRSLRVLACSPRSRTTISPPLAQIPDRRCCRIAAARTEAPAIAPAAPLRSLLAFEGGLKHVHEIEEASIVVELALHALQEGAGAGRGPFLLSTCSPGLQGRRSLCLSVFNAAELAEPEVGSSIPKCRCWHAPCTAVASLLACHSHRHAALMCKKKKAASKPDAAAI